MLALLRAHPILHVSRIRVNVEKTKAMVQSRRLGKGRTLTFEDHKIEVVRRFKYLGTVINDVNDETEEIRAGG